MERQKKDQKEKVKKTLNEMKRNEELERKREE